MSISMDFSVLARGDYPRQIAAGFLYMLELSALSLLLALTVAVVVATLRMSPSRIASAAAAAYVEFHQNVPLLVHIFLWYFGVPAILPAQLAALINANNGEFIFAFIAIGLCLGAYMSEDLRGGIRSIPTSQLEASRALGLSYLQASRHVILPQAVRIALPPLVNHTVLLFKNTSLAMTIGAAELTYATKEIESHSFRTFEVYVFSTFAYLGVSLLIMWGGSLLERRLRIRGR